MIPLQTRRGCTFFGIALYIPMICDQSLYIACIECIECIEMPGHLIVGVSSTARKRM
jgi:hypothetical protein